MVSGDAPNYWWLSFAGDEGFRGVVVARGQSFKEAVIRTTVLGLNPGGECYGYQLRDSDALDALPFTHRLFRTKEEIEKVFGPVAKPTDVDRILGHHACEDCVGKQEKLLD